MSGLDTLLLIEKRKNELVQSVILATESKAMSPQEIADFAYEKCIEIHALERQAVAEYTHKA